MHVGSAIVVMTTSLVMSTARLQEERRTNHKQPIGHVAVVGATHGNERMGLVIVDELRRAPPTCAFELSVLVGNEAAVVATGTGAGLRYVDTDLNRCFALDDLAREGVPDASEERRARELDRLLGPKRSAQPRCDLILDLHSTTSNTGVLLCLHPRDTFALELAAHLTSLDPTIRVALWPDTDDVALLPTIARSGLTIEVGACAHSTVVYSLLVRMRQVVLDALAYVELHNACLRAGGSGGAGGDAGERRQSELSLYKRAYTLDYPRTDGRVSAFIHPMLQGVRELVEPLQLSAPIFASLDGSVARLSAVLPALEEGEELFPMFVNEAAYVEKDVALILASRERREVAFWARGE
ncbi:hypothetical protein KFE25_007542 [Diacronema lutheri]|uniref:Succinylglutamate desuccinylase/Aspartoacylase catalytic domain-containing protein n=1 Tax=Diacronema lutheri TaxID=2081491 RepID=A0A8J5Y084_DIALT|nr:hypothetical protein KFE25_007542 [Diacronema lutheri]